MRGISTYWGFNHSQHPIISFNSLATEHSLIRCNIGLKRMIHQIMLSQQPQASGRKHASRRCTGPEEGGKLTWRGCSCGQMRTCTPCGIGTKRASQPLKEKKKKTCTHTSAIASHWKKNPAGGHIDLQSCETATAAARTRARGSVRFHEARPTVTAAKGPHRFQCYANAST